VVSANISKDIEKLLGAVEKTKSVDEITLERIWGERLTQISPEVRAIIVSALKKVREKKELFSALSRSNASSE
jgi:cell division protein FtsX